MKKITPKKSDDSKQIIEDILSPLPEKFLSLTQAIRKLIKKEVPGVIEKGYPVWKGIGYTHKEVGYFCAIFPFPDHINIGFEFGILLPDKFGRLSGTGSQLRYFQIKDKSDFDEKMISYYIQEALKLPNEKKVKMELIRVLKKGK